MVIVTIVSPCAALQLKTHRELCSVAQNINNTNTFWRSLTEKKKLNFFIRIHLKLQVYLSNDNTCYCSVDTPALTDFSLPQVSCSAFVTSTSQKACGQMYTEYGEIMKQQCPLPWPAEMEVDNSNCLNCFHSNISFLSHFSQDWGTERNQSPLDPVTQGDAAFCWWCMYQRKNKVQSWCCSTETELEKCVCVLQHRSSR